MRILGSILLRRAHFAGNGNITDAASVLFPLCCVCHTGCDEAGLIFAVSDGPVSGSRSYYINQF